MPKTKPPYPPEFRAEAVRLVQASGRPIKEIAIDLDVSEQTLRNWVFQAQVDQGERDGVTTDASALGGSSFWSGWQTVQRKTLAPRHGAAFVPVLMRATTGMGPASLPHRWQMGSVAAALQLMACVTGRQVHKP